MKKSLPGSTLVLKGIRDGVPIGMGYFAVAFSLGIAASNAAMHVGQGVVMSLLNHASAGEYAGIAAIKASAPYWELALLILIANARYLLMSTAISQKLSPKLPFMHRLFIGFGLTDELFGLCINHPGYTPPPYMYGAFLTSIPLWAAGTGLGIVAGNILPNLAVTALSAAIFGMFIAIVVPPARKEKALIPVILASFVLSSVFSMIPYIQNLSESLRVIILTLIISCAAAILRPVKDLPAEEESDTESV